MVDVDEEGEIVGSDDKGEVEVQGATNRMGVMGACTYRRRMAMCFKADKGVAQR